MNIRNRAKVTHMGSGVPVNHLRCNLHIVSSSRTADDDSTLHSNFSARDRKTDFRSQQLSGDSCRKPLHVHVVSKIYSSPKELYGHCSWLYLRRFYTHMKILLGCISTWKTFSGFVIDSNANLHRSRLSVNKLQIIRVRRCTQYYHNRHLVWGRKTLSIKTRPLYTITR